MRDMKDMFTPSRWFSAVCGLLLLLDAPRPLIAQATLAANAAFNAYSRDVEARLLRQHRSGDVFLASAGPDMDPRLRSGEVIVDCLSPPSGNAFPGALLHHWRGTAFAPGAKAADFEWLMRDFKAYPQHFAPQVLQAHVISGSGSRLQASMRIRQHHVITVVMDTTYDITFGQRDALHGYSLSRSTHIDEIDAPGTIREHALSPADEHGFLWRLNTYWSYEERDGGLYLQIEAVSLSRAIPSGLGWLVRPYVQSIPRESMEFTMRSAVNALKARS